MQTFYADLILGTETGTAPVGKEISAADMQDALRQLSAYEAGLAHNGASFSIERVSRSKTRSVQYVKGW